MPSVAGWSADHDVIEAVAVDVPRRGDRGSGAVGVRHAGESEAVGPVEARQVDVGGEPGHPAEHDVGRPHRIGPGRADDHIVEAVAVDIAGRGHGRAAVGVEARAAEPEAVGSVEAVDVEIGGKTGFRAEHHIADARRIPMGIGLRRAQDQVGQTVAVDVAGGSQGVP